METNNIGGALAGGLIATALLDVLLAKGLIARTDVRHVLNKARRTIGSAALNAEQRAAAAVLDRLLADYPENGSRK
jgi:hypothetical protein